MIRSSSCVCLSSQPTIPASIIVHGRLRILPNGRCLHRPPHSLLPSHQYSCLHICTLGSCAFFRILPCGWLRRRLYSLCVFNPFFTASCTVPTSQHVEERSVDAAGILRWPRSVRGLCPRTPATACPGLAPHPHRHSTAQHSTPLRPSGAWEPLPRTSHLQPAVACTDCKSLPRCFHSLFTHWVPGFRSPPFFSRLHSGFGCAG